MQDSSSSPILLSSCIYLGHSLSLIKPLRVKEEAKKMITRPMHQLLLNKEGIVRL